MGIERGSSVRRLIAVVRPLTCWRVGGLAEMDVFSVLLPTYNERQNLPLIVSMIVRAFESWCAAPIESMREKKR